MPDGGPRIDGLRRIGRMYWAKRRGAACGDSSPAQAVPRDFSSGGGADSRIANGDRCRDETLDGSAGRLNVLAKVISKMVGDDPPGGAGKRQRFSTPSANNV